MTAPTYLSYFSGGGLCDVGLRAAGDAPGTLVGLDPAGDDRPRLLDLFSGAGGAARGYQLAGFHVTGVDSRPQPRYAGDAFILGDAPAYVAAHGHEYDAIHASPPCQGYSATRAIWGREYPRMIADMRALLLASGRPWVIENVEGARADMHEPVMLCGTMFGLRLYRHRLFETSTFLLVPPHGRHAAPCCKVGRRPKAHEYLTVAGHFAAVDQARAAMGIDWMTREELSQAIPPAYCAFIGLALRREVARRIGAATVRGAH